jgi:hypothetical protein
MLAQSTGNSKTAWPSGTVSRMSSFGFEHHVRFARDKMPIERPPELVDEAQSSALQAVIVGGGESCRSVETQSGFDRHGRCTDLHVDTSLLGGCLLFFVASTQGKTAEKLGRRWILRT